MLPLRSAWAGGRDSRQPWRRVSWGASVIRPSAGGKRRGTKVSPASAGLHPTPPDPLRPRSGTRNSRHHQPFHRLRLPVNRKQIRVFRSLLMAKAVDISPGSHRPIAATPDHKGRSIRCAAQHTRKHKNDDQRTLSTRRRRRDAARGLHLVSTRWRSAASLSLSDGRGRRPADQCRPLETRLGHASVEHRRGSLVGLFGTITSVAISRRGH
jgi:hypothetical protein